MQCSKILKYALDALGRELLCEASLPRKSDGFGELRRIACPGTADAHFRTLDKSSSNKWNSAELPAIEKHFFFFTLEHKKIVYFSISIPEHLHDKCHNTKRRYWTFEWHL